MHISIGAEKLFNIGSFQVTNTILSSWFVVAFLIIVALLVKRGVKKYPNGKLALAIEGILSGFIDFMSTFAGDKKTVRKFLPIVGTLFFFVLTSNWAGTLPGVETIGIHKEAEHITEVAPEHTNTETSAEVAPSHSEPQTEVTGHTPSTEGVAEVVPTETEVTHSETTEESSHGEFLPLFRTVNSDLNMTLLLAVLIVVGSHVVGFATIGAKHHIGKFIVNPFKNPIGFFVGFLEIIGEFSRIISLAFRLFGNIFAGSVLMMIISFLAPFIIPIPFLGLELFVGFIQALVISVLAVMFLASATHKHEAH